MLSGREKYTCSKTHFERRGACSAFTDFKKRLDHTEYGGAPLLGVKGVCIITHGSSNSNAIKNAVRVAAEFSRRGVNDSIERGLAALRPVAVVAEVAQHQ